MSIPEQYRVMDSLVDVCCSAKGNLKEGRDLDGSVVDGCWVCSVCKRTWVGNGKDEYLNHPLETFTEFGERMFSAVNDVIKEGKHIELGVVLGRMAFIDREGTERMLSQSNHDAK